MTRATVEKWAIDTGVRAVKTFAQSLFALLGAGAVNVITVDWRTDVAIALGASLLSVLQNVGSLSEGSPTASHVA